MMLGMPHTVTIWNKYRTGNKDIWQRTILEGCSFLNTAGMTTPDNTQVIQDNILVVIPYRDGYVSKMEWLDSDDKSGCFTFGVGDLVVLGSCPDDINNSDITAVKLKNQYAPDSFIIKTVTDRTAEYMRAKHWEIGGD